MGYWKSKVLPKIRKVFDLRITGRKAAAAEACKTFDDSKEAINKEIEEKKTELQPKVVETYEATSAELKALVKEPKEDGVKKQAVEVHKFLEELVKIEFPGSKAVCEASTNHGVTNVSGPVFFIFEKVCVFLPVEEEKARELPQEVKAEEAPKAEAKTEESSGGKGKDIVVEEKEEESKTEEEKKKEEAKSEEKKSEEMKTESKTEKEKKKEEAKPEEKKPEVQTDEKKKEEKVEEKKELPVAPAAKAEEKPAEQKKP